MWRQVGFCGLGLCWLLTGRNSYPAVVLPVADLTLQMEPGA